MVRCLIIECSNMEIAVRLDGGVTITPPGDQEQVHLTPAMVRSLVSVLGTVGAIRRIMHPEGEQTVEGSSPRWTGQVASAIATGG